MYDQNLASQDKSLPFRFPPLFMPLIVTVIAAVSFAVAFFRLPFVVIPASAFFVASFLLVSRPLALLSLLVVSRMSLDIFENSVPITLGENISLSLSQAIGIEVALLGSIALIPFRYKLFQLPLSFPLFTILLWGSFSLIISIDPSATARDLIRVLDLLILFALAFFSIKKKGDARIMLSAFFVSSVVPVLVGLYQFVFGIGFQDESVSIPRIFGTFSHPNIFSLYLFSLIAICTLFLTAFCRTPAEKLVVKSLGVLYAAMLFFTYTRIAWAILFIFLLILSVFKFRKLLFPLLIVPAAAVIFITPFQDRLLDSFRSSPDSSVSWRIGLWQDATRATVLQGDALLGNGMNTFSLVSENIRGMSRGPSNDPHNDFVKFFVEGGVLGLWVFCFSAGYILWYLSKRFFRTRPGDVQTSFLILFSFFASLLFASLSDNVFKNTPVQWIFWISLGSILALSTKNEVDLKEKEKPTIPVLQK